MEPTHAIDDDCGWLKPARSGEAKFSERDGKGLWDVLLGWRGIQDVPLFSPPRSFALIACEHGFFVKQVVVPMNSPLPDAETRAIERNRQQEYSRQESGDS